MSEERIFREAGFSKRVGFGGCSPGTKTGTRVHSDVSPGTKTGTRAHSHVTRNENRNEGTF